jgi:patatin-like phospholipase/acyl hydrolase
MREFRKNVALAIDGGGIRGIIPAAALMEMEKYLGLKCGDVFKIFAGTSTGSIISAALSLGMNAEEVYNLYLKIGPQVFKKNIRSYMWLLFPPKYSNDEFQKRLQEAFGNKLMSDLWRENGIKKDLVIPVTDLVEDRTRLVKSHKDEYKNWLVWLSVLCSCAAPLYLPVVNGRFVDGGLSVFNNPCYVAAFEAAWVLKWDLKETTLISLGTGRLDNKIELHQADHWRIFKWAGLAIDRYSLSTNDEQVAVVAYNFPEIDFRRFQVNLDEKISLDDASPAALKKLSEYGKKLGEMIINDKTDVSAVRMLE